MMNRGFTLVEILVVIGITAIIGTIMVAIFTNTLRGSNKSQILAIIKQNGQAVLENMDKTIRGEDNVVCPTSGSSNTLVIIQNGIYTRYRIVLPTDSTGSAPSSCIGTGKNGCIIWENLTLQATEVTPQLCNPTNLMSAAQVSTDTNTQLGVSVSSGSFSVSQPPGYKAAVTVNFELGAAVGLPPVSTSQIDPVVFQTTVQLR